jgi:phage shock protein C
MERRLYRSRKNRLFLGVCGGLGEYFKMDPMVIRVIAVLITIASAFSAIVAYFILALIVPVEGSKATTPRDAFNENIAGFSRTTNKLKDESKAQQSGPADRNEVIENNQGSVSTPTVPKRSSGKFVFTVAVVLIVIGIYFFIINLIPRLRDLMLPMILIMSGFIIIAVVLGRLGRHK